MNVPLAIESDGLGLKIIRDSLGNAIAYRIGASTAKGIVEAVNGYATLKAQRDEFLASVRKIECNTLDANIAMIARAAIANVERSEGGQCLTCGKRCPNDCEMDKE